MTQGSKKSQENTLIRMIVKALRVQTGCSECSVTGKLWRNLYKLGVLVPFCNPSTWEGEVGGLQIQGKPGLYSETLSKNKA
jgi:hypothetical protein